MGERLTKTFDQSRAPIISNEDPRYVKPTNHKFTQERDNLVNSNGGQGFSLNLPSKIIDSHNNKFSFTTRRWKWS